MRHGGLLELIVEGCVDNKNSRGRTLMNYTQRRIIGVIYTKKQRQRQVTEKSKELLQTNLRIDY
jgi:hypothetical protein